LFFVRCLFVCMFVCMCVCITILSFEPLCSTFRAHSAHPILTSEPAALPISTLISELIMLHTLSP
jgi:hypothetical protein